MIFQPRRLSYALNRTMLLLLPPLDPGFGALRPGPCRHELKEGPSLGTEQRREIEWRAFHARTMANGVRCRPYPSCLVGWENAS
ncbi:hypothetical protein QBC37DRAFT_64030 [Rhypophila decipiens]|uniref:Uncharacterized protein n=1 Tax=Rhypophila decipiens TaxID=261697 RepID=A0AAN6XYC4_9PEZI|nr:hypothetical protein QBC37DRAFT_64030 [Rhypophila decipiens]